MATYNYGQLEQLWQQAGGSARLAPTMAAIALAESGGRTTATHHDSDGSTDYGLWQINSVHGYNTGQLLSSPLYNAKAAVSIENSSGLHAWSTYNNGAYKRYLGGARSSGPVIFADPSSSGQAKYVRTDQGVDITSPTAYTAVAAGTVVHIDPNFYNGTPAVYIKLDKPVTVNGRKYTGVYYAETRSLVRVGQHLTVGQDVIAGGAAEVGFAKKFGSSPSSWLPAAHGSYTEGQPTQAGADFLTAIGGKNNYLSGNTSGTGSVTAPAASLAQHIPGVVQAEAIGNFLGKLTSAAFWLRAAEVIGGGILVLLGLYLLAKQIGLGDVGVPLPSGATTAADQAATAAMTQKFRENEARQQRDEAKERRAEEAHMAQLEERSARADLARARAETARTNRRPRMESHSLDTPTKTRRQQLAAKASDPATNEIPF